MLNRSNERELAYVVIIDNILPIENADRVEQAVVGGWRVMTRKGQFQPGDPAIYFEIDSKVPETEAFEFLAPKHYKVKTQKYFKGTVISQGLLMHAEDFGWLAGKESNDKPFIVDNENHKHYADDESRFLTKKLNVIYAEAADNARKARSDDKYKRMAQRHGKLFSHQPFRWMMKHTLGKKILFLFFGRKKDKRGWPAWVVKTDEERIENMPWVLENKDPWIVTEKIDGTSTTFTYKKGRFKDEFYVCSRNVVFDKPDKQCFYDSNVYVEMAEKYDMENVLKRLLKEHYPNAQWVTIQGETFGEGIQKRDYSMKGHDLRVFNLIVSDRGRVNSFTMKEILEKEYNIPCVPILDLHYILPDTIDELREYVDSQPSTIDGKIKEGVVIRSQDGSKSFKCVSPSYLLKFHQ